MDDVLGLMTRNDIADFVAALVLVYTICIVGWVVLSLVFSLGVRVPYNRFVNGGDGLPARRLGSRSCACSGGCRCRSGRST